MSVYELSNVISAFSDAGMFFLLFEAFLEHRKKLRSNAYVTGVICLGIALGVCNYFLMFQFVNVIAMMLLAGIVSLLYKGGLRSRVLAVIITPMIGLIVEVVVVYFVTFALQMSVEDMIHASDYHIFCVLASKITGLAICNVVRVQSRRKSLKLGRDFWLAFLLLFCSYLIVTFQLFEISYKLETAGYNTEILLSSLGLFLCTAFSLFLYERQSRQSAAIREQEQYEQQLKFQLKHLDDLLAKQNELRKFKHDIDNQMEGLRGYLQAGDTSGGLHHLDAITDRLKMITPAFNTGNPALDATLSAKKTLAEEQGIHFSTKLNLEENLPIAPEDICTIFGNALDNAIEACLSLDENQQKSIDISLVQLDTVLLCKIVNTAPEQTGNDLSTSKKDRENHGFGLANLRESLAKYDSTPEIEWQQGKFSLSFVLPLKNKT